MEIKKLKKVMEAIELLHTEKLVSEKVASKYLTEYLAKQHEEKQEQLNRLNPQLTGEPKFKEEIRADYPQPTTIKGSLDVLASIKSAIGDKYGNE